MSFSFSLTVSRFPNFSVILSLILALITGNLSISCQYIVFGTGRIGGNVEFYYYSMVFFVGIFVGIMINVIGGVHNG